MLRPEDRERFEAACARVAGRHHRARPGADQRLEGHAGRGRRRGRGARRPRHRRRREAAVPRWGRVVWDPRSHSPLRRSGARPTASTSPRRPRCSRVDAAPRGMVGAGGGSPASDDRRAGGGPRRRRGPYPEPSYDRPAQRARRSPSGASVQVGGLVEVPQQPVAGGELDDAGDRAVVGVDERERAAARDLTAQLADHAAVQDRDAGAARADRCRASCPARGRRARRGGPSARRRG